MGPVAAMASETFAPPMNPFRRGRDFAAWLGPVPRQHSSGGKQALGLTSETGPRDIRRLLVVGAMAVVHAASLQGARAGSRLARMMDRIPRMVVAIELANKMTRGLWATMMAKQNHRTAMAATT